MGTLNLTFRPTSHQLGTDGGSGERMSNWSPRLGRSPSSPGLLGSPREPHAAPAPASLAFLG